MHTDRNTKRTEHARCIIEHYRKEIKDNTFQFHNPLSPFSSSENDEKIKRFYCFPYLFSALFYDPAPEQICFIAEEAGQTAGRADVFQIERMMRTAPREIAPVDFAEWERGCREAGRQDGNLLLLSCGASHPNGYFREKCLKQLAGQRGALPFILFRLNDRVPAVRRAAQELLAEQIRMPDAGAAFVAAMPAAEYVRRSERANRDAAFSMDMLDRVLMQLFEKNPERVIWARASVRRLCYKVFAEHPAPEYCGLLLHFYQKERDGELRYILERTYLQSAGASAPAKTLAIFTDDRYSRIRLCAYEYRLRHEGQWDGFSELLFSQSGMIRRFAAAQLKKSGFDLPGFCRENLPKTIAVLSENGTESDIPLIRPYLESHPAEAMAALVRLGAADGSKLIYDYMHSDDAALAKTAFRLAGSTKCFEIPMLYAMISNETDPKLQWRFAYLLTKDGVRNVLHLLLRLVKDCPRIRRSLLYLISEHTSRQFYVSRQHYDEVHKALSYVRTGNALPYDFNNRIYCNMQPLMPPDGRGSI